MSATTLVYHTSPPGETTPAPILGKLYAADRGYRHVTYLQACGCELRDLVRVDATFEARIASNARIFAGRMCWECASEEQRAARRAAAQVQDPVVLPRPNTGTCRECGEERFASELVRLDGPEVAGTCIDCIDRWREMAPDALAEVA